MGNGLRTERKLANVQCSISILSLFDLPFAPFGLALVIGDWFWWSKLATFQNCPTLLQYGLTGNAAPPHMLLFPP